MTTKNKINVMGLGRRLGPIGLYVHIPFCRSKCGYCDFYSLAGSEELIDPYLKALKAHMRESAQLLRLNTVDSLYFGGGTPTCIGADRLAGLLKFMRRSFDIVKAAEITFEANPDTVDLKSLKKLRAAGFNRISFGVQSADDSELKTLGRIHSYERAVEAYDLARRAGFENINLDVMFALPGQGTEGFLNSLAKIISLSPEHISCYALKLEGGCPLCARASELPDEEIQADMYLRAVELLKKSGYEQYEISNFAKGGHVCRHNLKYWTLEPYIGFGAAASSDFGGKRYTNVKDVKAYIAGVTNADTVIDEYDEISTLERAGEYIMLSARTVRGMSGSEYTAKYRVSFNEIEKRLEKLREYGLAESTGDRWRLTPKGFFVSNRIIGILQEALPEK